MHSIAKKIILLNAAEIVISSEDNVYWKDSNRRFQTTKLSLQRNKANSIKIDIPSEMSPLQRELIYQFESMKFNEQKLYKHFEKNNSYIRIFFGGCYLREEGKLLSVYPQIKLYKNGILLVTFRKMLPDTNLTIEEFINYEVNIVTKSFDEILLPAGIIFANELASRKSSKYKLYNRKSQYNTLAKVMTNIKNSSKLIRETDFCFNVIPVVTGNINEELNLDMIKDMFLVYISYFANMSLLKPLNKRKNEKYSLHTYFRGVPSIFLLNFSNQPDSKKQFDLIHNRVFNKILARSDGVEKIDIEEKDYRLYDDYSVFANEAVILWVLSKQGLLSNEDYTDPNRGHLIYDKQVQSEMMMFMFGLKHKLFTISNSSEYTVLEVIKQKNAINQMERDFTEASNFGEINDLLKGYSQMFFKLQENTDINLSLKKELGNELNQKKINTFSWIIAIFFGLLSISSFSKDFLLPLWKVFTKPNSAGYIQDLETVVAYLTSASITIIFLILLFFLINRRRF
ncbi:hypothetical protein ACQCN2_16220 [Brevibacillus ginsengisoli]|uniref:hypothetical protein n=1 Tax=Brevibacillus ginsengisoli TaxID=363854 RepID=UPI003CE69DFD